MSAGDPLEALAILESYIVRCGHCPQDVQRAIDSVRRDLRTALDEPRDPLEDAAHALMLAESQLRGYHGSHGEAIMHEIMQAALCVGRARALRG